MTYRAPGVTVSNQFQLVANSNQGSAITTCTAGEITASLEAYPTKTTEVVRTSAVTDTVDAAGLADSFSTAITSPGLFDTGILTSSARMYKALYDLYDYTGLRTTGVATTNLQAVQVTKGAGDTDAVLTTVLYTATATILPLINGSAYTVLDIVDEDGVTYTAGTSGWSYTAATSDTASMVTVDWSAATSAPATGKNYYFIYGDVDTSVVANQAAILAAQFYFVNVLDAANKVVNWKLIWKGEKDTNNFLYTTAPAPGATYQFITKSEFPATIKPYTSFSEVAGDWGDAVLQDGTLNSLSFAAYLAFNEGASIFEIAGYDGVAKDSDGNHRTYAETLDDMLLEDDINIVTVLDNTTPTAVTDEIKMLANHALSASSMTNKKYRIAIAGIDVSGSADDTQAYKDAAEYVSSNRVLLVGPSKVTFSLTLPGSSTVQKYTVGAEYLAVIMAAMWGRPESDVATSLCRKESRTILDLSPRYIDSKLNLIASKGISLFAKVRGRYVMRDDITTNITSMLETQPYVTLTSDNIALESIETLDASVIGMKMLVPVTLELIKGALVSMLDQKQRANLIQAYSAPIVTIDPTNALKIVVTIQIVPMLATKYIDITYTYTVRS